MQPQTKQKGVHQAHTLQLQIPYERAFERCQAALGSINVAKSEQLPAEGRIKARTKISWKSFGEIVEFTLSKVNDNMTQVVITSKPALPTTLFDYGKNSENVKKICAFLTGKSSKAT